MVLGISGLGFWGCRVKVLSGSRRFVLLKDVL